MADEHSTATTSPEEYGGDCRADFLSMYHEYAASAERNSERRGNANTIFVTVNAAILGLSQYFDGGLLERVIPALAGVLMCFIWHGLINSYKRLSSAKFAIILEMEKSLPAQPYTREWARIQRGNDDDKHRLLSDLESLTPVAFGLLYLFMILMSATVS